MRLMGKRGSGTLYRRGDTWWIQYCIDGQRYRESSHSADRDEAERQLRVKLGDISAGRAIAPGTATIDDLFRLVLADYRMRGLRDAKIVEWRYRANVGPVLGPMRVAHVKSAQIRAYITARLQGASPATVNRELAIIWRAFALGRDEDPPLVGRVPKIPHLAEDNARRGFLEPEQYDVLLSEMPARLKALFVIGYHTGARKGELRRVRWSQVSMADGVIRLDATQTKTKRARSLPIYGDMARWLLWQRQRVEQNCPWVFSNRGRPVSEHLQGWHEACERAGCAGLLFHDLRRSAVRNMIRAGISEKTAMEISGHRTRAMFDRYNIVSGADIQDAARKLTEYRKAQRPALRLVEKGA